MSDKRPCQHCCGERTTTHRVLSEDIAIFRACLPCAERMCQDQTGLRAEPLSSTKLSKPQTWLLRRLPDLPSDGARVSGAQKRVAHSLEGMGFVQLVGSSPVSEAHYYGRTPRGSVRAGQMGDDSR